MNDEISTLPLLTCRTQLFSGLFRGPFVLQTFAYHFTVISGHIKVPQLYPEGVLCLPRGSLGMAASAVSHTHVQWHLLMFLRLSGLSHWSAIIVLPLTQLQWIAPPLERRVLCSKPKRILVPGRVRPVLLHSPNQLGVQQLEGTQQMRRRASRMRRSSNLLSLLRNLLRRSHGKLAARMLPVQKSSYKKKSGLSLEMQMTQRKNKVNLFHWYRSGAHR